MCLLQLLFYVVVIPKTIIKTHKKLLSWPPYRTAWETITNLFYNCYVIKVCPWPQILASARAIKALVRYIKISIKSLFTLKPLPEPTLYVEFADYHQPNNTPPVHSRSLGFRWLQLLMKIAYEALRLEWVITTLYRLLAPKIAICYSQYAQNKKAFNVLGAIRIVLGLGLWRYYSFHTSLMISGVLLIPSALLLLWGIPTKKSIIASIVRGVNIRIAIACIVIKKICQAARTARKLIIEVKGVYITAVGLSHTTKRWILARNWGRNTWKLVARKAADRSYYPALMPSLIALICLLIAHTHISFTTHQWSHTIVATMVVGIPTYLLWQTFMYFSKLYTSNKYTSYIGTFWNKTYVVFWGLEISLYCLFIYFWYISPEAPQAVIGQATTIRLVVVSLKTFLSTFLLLLVIMLISLFLLIARNYHNPLLIAAGFIILLPIHAILIRDEYLYFVYNCTEWNYWFEKTQYHAPTALAEVHPHNPNSATPLELVDIIRASELRRGGLGKEIMAAYSLHSSIWFLRFFHVLFVYLTFALIAYQFSEKGYTSYEALAVIFSNAVVLAIFNLTYLITYVKAIGQTMIVNSSEAYALDAEREWSVRIMFEVAKLCLDWF